MQSEWLEGISQKRMESFLSWQTRVEGWQIDPISFAEEFDLWKLPVEPKWFHREWLHLAARGQNILLKAPKDYAKSTCFSFILPIYLMCMDPDIRILLAGPVLKQSKRRVAAIKNELMANKKLRKVFGKFDGRPWHDEEITISQRRNKSLVDGTVKAVGIGSEFTGSRADVIIPDDICTLENTGTPERRAKVGDWFWDTLSGCREAHTPILMVGTRKHYGDLYAEITNTVGWHVPTKYERADYVDSGGRFRSYWPELWPASRLEAMFRQNSAAYNRDKRNLPLSPEDSAFPEEWLRDAKEQGRGFTFGPARSLGLQYVVQAWDVAGLDDERKAVERDTDYYACATIGINKAGKRQLAEVWRQRGMTPKAWVGAVSYMAERHQPDVIVVETNGVQWFHRAHAKEETQLPLLSHQTDHMHKVQLKNRTAALSVRMENREYVFPYGDARSQSLVNDLCEELNRYGSTNKKDMAMALFMADLYLKFESTSDRVVAVGSPRLVPPVSRMKEGESHERAAGAGSPVRFSGPGPSPWR